MSLKGICSSGRAAWPFSSNREWNWFLRCRLRQMHWMRPMWVQWFLKVIFLMLKYCASGFKCYKCCYLFPALTHTILCALVCYYFSYLSAKESATYCLVCMQCKISDWLNQTTNTTNDLWEIIQYNAALAYRISWSRLVVAFIYLHEQPLKVFVRRCVAFLNSPASPSDQLGGTINGMERFLKWYCFLFYKKIQALSISQLYHFYCTQNIFCIMLYGGISECTPATLYMENCQNFVSWHLRSIFRSLIMGRPFCYQSYHSLLAYFLKGHSTCLKE